MRILLVNAFYPPLTTGSSNFTANLAIELADRGHDVRVVTTRPTIPFDPSEDVVRTTRLTAHWIKPGPIAFNYAIPLLRRGQGALLRKVMEDFEPAVVSCHGQVFDITWRAVRSARNLGIPAVVSVHTAIRHMHRLADAVLAAAEFGTVQPMLRGDDIDWIGVDKRTYEHIRDRYRVRAERLHFVPIMLRTEQFAVGNGAAARQRFDLGDGPLLLSLGHVVPVRNRVALVRAMPLLLEARPDLKVVVVGEIYNDEFLRVADELGVRSSLVTTGRVPFEAVPDLLAAAVLEMHDLQGLGIGIGTTEAMAAGAPVVVYAPDDNYPGLSLKAAFPDLALVYDDEPSTVASAALLLLDDAQHRAAVVAEQHRFVDSIFTPRVVTDAYEEIFENAIARVMA